MVQPIVGAIVHGRGSTPAAGQPALRKTAPPGGGADRVEFGSRSRSDRPAVSGLPPVGQGRLARLKDALGGLGRRSSSTAPDRAAPATRLTAEEANPFALPPLDFSAEPEAAHDAGGSDEARFIKEAWQAASSASARATGEFAAPRSVAERIVARVRPAPAGADASDRPNKLRKSEAQRQKQAEKFERKHPVEARLRRQGGTGPDWIAQEATQARLEEARARQDEPARPGGVPVDASCITTQDNQGFGLDGGRVYAWNQKDRAWADLGLKGVQLIRLGGNGQAVMLMSDGRLKPLGIGRNCELQEAPALLRLKGKVHDFAMSPAGSLAALLAPPPAAHARAGSSHTTAPRLLWMPSDSAARPVALPMPEADRGLRSLAFDGHGTLYALDEAGQVWRANPKHMAERPDAVDWQRVHLPTADAHGGFVALKSLRNGTVAGVDRNGMQWPSSGDATWRPVLLNDPRTVDALYAKYPLDGPHLPVRTNFALLGPQSDRNTQGARWWKPGFLRRDPGVDHPGARLRDRWGNFFRSHTWPSDATSGKQVRALAQAGFDALRAAGTAGPRLPPEVVSGVVPQVDEICMEALTRLQQELGMADAQGRPIDGHGQNPVYQSVRENARRLPAERDVLRTLLDWRGSRLPRDGGSEAARAVTAALQRLVDAGVRLPIQPQRSAMNLHAIPNPCEGLTNALVQFHLLLDKAGADVHNRQAIGRGTGGDYLARTGRDVERLVKHWAGQVDGISADPLAQLYQKGVVNLGEYLKADPGKALRRELRADRQALSAMPATVRPMAGSVRAALGPELLANADKALDMLDMHLGLINTDGSQNPRFAEVKAYRKVRATADKVHGANNALQVAHDRLQQLYQGVADPQATRVIGRLQALLDKNIYLDIEGGRRLVAGRDPGGPIQLHWTKNKVHVPVAKMLNDLIAAADASGKVSEKSRDDQARQACVEAMKRIDGSDGNGISRLFSYGMVNADRGEKALRIVRNVTAGLGQKGHPVNRALMMQGRVARADQWIDRLMELAPGESIALKWSRAGGFDFDGLGFPFSFSDRGKDGIGKLSVKFNPIPNAQPVPSGMATREHSVTFTRTDKGLQLSFGQVSEADLKPLAIKLMWGAGATGNVGIARGVGYVGFEVIPGVSINIRKDHSVSMTLDQNDDGRLRTVMQGLLNGTLTPHELLGVCAAISSTRGLTKTGKLTTDVNFLAALVGIVGIDAIRHKGILAWLNQLNLEAKTTHGVSRTHAADGSLTEGRVNKTEGAIKDTHIGVVEIQVPAFYYDTINPHRPQETIAGAAEVQSKLPLWIVLEQYQWLGNALANEGVSVRRDPSGKIVGVDMLVRALNTPLGGMARKIGLGKMRSDSGKAFSEKNLPQLAELLHQQPGLRPYIEKIQKTKLPVHALMELKPEVMRELARLSNPAQADEARARVNALARNPANWRIAEIKIDGTRAYKSSALVGVVLLRYASRAENAFTTNLAKAIVHHGDAPSFDLRGEFFVGDGVKPDFDQLKRTAQDRGSERLESLLALNGQMREWQVFATMPRERTRPGEGLAALGHRLLAPLGQGPREAHFALRGGFPVYRAPLPTGGWREVDVPGALQNALLEQITGHVEGGAFGADAVLLLMLHAMSHGETGRLAPASEVDRGLLRTMKALAADAHTPAARHDEPSTAPTGRALHVSDILDDLHRRRQGDLSQLDPAQRLVLRTFFRTPEGLLDRASLVRVLSDKVQLEAFKKSIARVEEGRRRQRSAARSDDPESLVDARLHGLEERRQAATSQNSSQPVHTSVM